MKEIEKYRDFIHEYITEEFMMEGFLGNKEEETEEFLKNNYLPVFIPEQNILFIFRPATKNQETDFPNKCSDAEILMMGKAKDPLGLFVSVNLLVKRLFLAYPWTRVWARTKNSILARFYEKMGMKFVCVTSQEKEECFFYLWTR